ncbi:EcoKI restriction-modification system protein HsdS [Pirellula sp. SH-Sr6A]|uniref:restriction endonuclease subunit S n=1 Tax=Pirellula sp. SH-Sr6A TaxID=1632865 RepID=UPI00078D5B8C|nr:restriction endonuclease subunit S [Pirellula sp. SH-Sr6A]AMV31705.1 EcoKI restriction-modification system protein HsdS [Pirellula sp. SH-Sr6A]
MSNLVPPSRDNWSEEPLGDLCEIVIGRTPRRNNAAYWNGSLPWVSIADLNQGRLLRKTKESITPLGATESRSRLIPTGTVLLSFKLSIGKVSITDIDVFTNEAIAALPIRDSSRLNRDYLFWCLKSIRLDEEVDAAAKGKTLNSKKLERIAIPIPPLDEQRRIAAVLDKADALRRQRQESLQLTEKLLQSVFVEMFGTENSPQCPRVKLADHLEFITTGGRGWAKYYSNEGARFIRSLDVRMNEIDSSQMVCVNAPKNAEAERTRTRDGDVLLTMTGSLIGRVAPVTAQHSGGYISQHVAILRAKGFQPEFLSWAISTEEGQRQIQKHQTGQTKPGLNFEQVRRLLVPRPPIEDEKKFCDLIRRRRIILADQRASLAQCESLFAATQQRAFRGELDLSRLTLEALPATEIAPELPGHHHNDGVYNRPGFFIAPPEIEAKLKTMEEQLSWGPGDSIPWSEDYFKYRTLSQLLVPPFSFDDVWQKTIYDMEEADYETVKDRIFKYLASGLLVQEFDEERREIVFRPRT